MKEYTKDKLNRVKRGANRAVYDIETINNILDAGFLGHIAYVYDGYPISIPMAYTRIDDKIYLHGSTANRMFLSLLEAEKASMTVTHLDGLVLARSAFHHSVNYRSTFIYGSFSKVVDKDSKTKVLKKVVDHIIDNRWDTLRPMTQKEFDRTLVVELTIESASAKVRAEGVGDEPKDYKENVWAGIVPIRQIAEQPIADEGIPQQMELPEHIIVYYEKHKY